MSKRKPTQQVPAQAATNSRSPLSTILWVVGALLLVGLLGLVVWISRQPTLVAAPEPTATLPPTATPLAILATPNPVIATGAVDSCRKLPEFRKAVGFDSQTAVLSTSERSIKGLVLYDVKNTQAGYYQHPSWTEAGYLGHVILDGKGDVYLYPAPRVSLIDNPPEKQNIVYRVDGTTGVMAAWLPLPSAQAPSTENPFGLMGLAYDCDTNTLYAASVAGSTRQQELGKIFRISVAEAKVLSTYDNVDAFGINIYKGSTGKRLYFASARTTDVRSIALDWQGEFAGNERLDGSLTGLGPTGDDRGRRIRFDRDGNMTVTGMEFRYNLVAQSETRQTDYLFKYDKNADTWTYQQ
ncbi:MAG: hypothetical protein U0175_30090 [Caldilineaceae bacterium]